MNSQNCVVVGSQPDTPKVDFQAPETPMKRFRNFMCGWGILVTAGAVSLTFLLCISLVPSTNIFPVHKDPYANNVPLIQQGSLRVYPRFLDGGEHSWTNDRYYINLAEDSLKQNVEALQNLTKNYPKEHELPQYRQCWLQNPTYEYPCFFHMEWLGNFCTEDTDFGYRVTNGTFNPCIILRIEGTKDWSPFPDIHKSISQFSMKGSDPGFVAVDCFPQLHTDQKKFKIIKMSPPKGFSRLFFPVSNFDPKLYLFPVVAVQVKGLVKGENTTIECQLRAQNAFFLDGNGRVTITFGS